MATPSAPALRPTPLALAVLLGGSAANLGLSIYQWLELLTVRRGGVASCAIDATFNCATVWNTPFASRIHELSGLPVAGTGVLWAGTALLLSVLWAVKARAGEAPAHSAALKLWAWAGLMATVMLATAAMRSGAVCVLCLTTYVLVAVFAFGALKLVPGGLWPQSNALFPGMGWVFVVSAPMFLVLQFPARATPRVTTVSLQNANPENLAAFIANLPEQEKMMASVARELWLKNQARDTAAFPTRQRKGPADARVAVVDFTDIKCGHCKVFEETMAEIQKFAPKGSFSIEPRYFPIDKPCNSEVQKDWGDGVRCLAAQVQVCLEQNEKFWDVRHDLFANQQTLTQDLIWKIAEQSGTPRATLEDCVKDEATQRKIQDDVLYAKLYGIQGTPLVLLNGKETLPSGPFIYGMILSGGDANAEFFKALPPPPPPGAGHDDHAGHNH